MTRKELRRTLIVLLVLAPFAFGLWIKFPICPTAAAFGIPCPGCGLTRATLALLHGDLRGALRLHPLVFLITPIYLAVVLQAIVSYVRPEHPELFGFSRWLGSRAASFGGSALLVLLLGVWGARFFGFLGGPAPVETMREWVARHAAR